MDAVVTTILSLLSSLSDIIGLLLPAICLASTPACLILRGLEVAASCVVTCATDQSCYHPASWGHGGWGGSGPSNVVAMLS